jgi:hypothetical protein
MNIESYINIQWTNLETGYVTADIQVFLDTFFQTMQNGLSDNGWTLPQQTTVNINALLPIMPNGTLWYNTDTDSIQAKIGGVIKTITAS